MIMRSVDSEIIFTFSNNKKKNIFDGKIPQIYKCKTSLLFFGSLNLDRQNIPKH